VSPWWYVCSFVSFAVFFAPFVSFPAQFQLARGHGVFRALFHIEICLYGSNMSMDTMTDSWDPSGVLRDAPCDEVSHFLSWRGRVLQTMREPTAARFCARTKPPVSSPKVRGNFLGDEGGFILRVRGLKWTGMTGHNPFLILLPRGLSSIMLKCYHGKNLLILLIQND